MSFSVIILLGDFMKLYIITGASGLVGTNLIRKLDKDGNKIIALINKTPLHYKSSNIEEINTSVCDFEKLETIFKKYDVKDKICIHAAGIITIKSKNDENVYNVNVNGTKNIIDLCLKYDYKLIYVSSVHAIKEEPYPNIIKETNTFYPEQLKGAYAITKATASNMFLEACKKGLKGIIVQPSAIIGPYDYNKGNFTTLIENYINGKLPAIVKGGYDFVDVRDVVDGIIKAIDKGKFGECYILSNKYYSVKELIDTLSLVTNKKKVKIIMPTWFVKLLAPLFELYSNVRHHRPLFTPYSIYVLHTNSLFSNEKAKNELNYTTHSLEDTLKTTYEWIKNKN